MSKGPSTQSVAVLLSQPCSLEALQNALGAFEVVRTSPPEAGPTWHGGHASALVAFRAEVNGYALVEIIDQPWPDGMGSEAEPDLFGAWGAGAFGPFVHPNALERTLAQSRHTPRLASLVSLHKAFLRVRTGYTFGAKADDAAALPKDYAPLNELLFVVRLAQALLAIPEALCVFNPNGETLHTAESLESSLAWHRERGLVPLEVFSNVRVFQPSQTPGWILLDTVGMDQLDAIDQEACFPQGKFEPQEVANFLRNMCVYVFEEGPVIREGNTAEGPAETRWRVRLAKEALVPRPRRTLRWFPEGETPPHLLMPGAETKV